MTTLKVRSPFDQKLIKEVPLATTKQMEKALDRAYNLFSNPANWLPKFRRVEILENIAFILEERSEEIIHIAAKEGGKPLIDTQIEMARAINGVKLAIENIGQLKGEEVAMGHTQSSANRLAYTMIEPIGVVAAVSAYNHPINLIIHQTIPAIAVGAPVIIKPASATPLTCLLLVEIFEAAGLPEGWCTPIICDNNVTEQLVTSPKINFFSFIGSARVGWYLRSKLSPGTRCALEHGGAAPVVVEPDADIKTMLPALVKGGYYHAGQVCVSVQRVYVHESIIDQVVEGIDSLARSLKVGDPLEESTEVGPLILPEEVDRIHEWVQEAIAGGGKLICGGRKVGVSCYEPTLLVNPPKDAQVSTKEVFGPLICIYSYTNRDEAIDRANSLPFGFQSSVFTRDLNIALDTVKKLNSSAVMVNDHTAFRVDWMPFGGRDASGLGFGSIPHTMKDMTREKLMVIKSSVL